MHKRQSYFEIKTEYLPTRNFLVILNQMNFHAQHINVNSNRNVKHLMMSSQHTLA